MVFGLNSERSLNVDMDNSAMSSSQMRSRTSARNSLARQGSVSFLGLSVNRPARYRSTSGGNRTSTRDSAEMDDINSQSFRPVRSKAAYRRYRVGENVLICCNSHWATLVNRYGFPPGEGTTVEEQSGPYAYVLATVKTVHFDEFAEYYTVKRVDNGVEQRADSGTF